MSEAAKRRWRLALGRYANEQLGQPLGQDAAMDRSLDYLYSREYKKRGIGSGRGPGSSDPTQMNAINWLGEAQKLFPASVFEVLQDHALDRYGLSDLLSDPATLDSLEPNQNLLKVLLGFQGRAKPEVKQKLREVAQKVIDELVERLKSDVQRAFSGRRNRFRRSNIASAANFDWRKTIQANLKNYDPVGRRIIADNVFFNSRERRHLPWHVILCVDQSGSMTDSMIHAAVMAAILSGLPGVSINMVLFDTSIIDVSDQLTDPLETLLSVQLGGGTDIGRATSYCEQFIKNGERTVFALISDFEEGSSPRTLYSSIARMAEQRVRLVGLTALDEGGEPYYDAKIAGRCADIGMKVGAMTTDRFAQWLAEIMQ